MRNVSANTPVSTRPADPRSAGGPALKIVCVALAMALALLAARIVGQI